MTVLECNFHNEDSVEKYVQKSDKLGQKLIKLNKLEIAETMLNQVYLDLTTQVSKLYNHEKIKILKTRAELRLVKGDAKNCLEDLKLCYRLANASKLSKLKIGELLINMTHASSEVGFAKQALHYAEEAVN